MNQNPILVCSPRWDPPFSTSQWIRNKHTVAMEILEANAVPLGYDPPTPDEKMKSKELEAYLR